MRKYRRITYEDRCQIYALSKRGASQESIAGVLGVSQSTMSREMCRNRGQRGYRFKQAEAKAQARQAIRSRPRKLTAPLRRKIEAKLRQMRWSPEQISGWLFEQGIKLSHERIYQMIWQDKRDGGDLWRSLRRRGKRYNKRGGKNAGRGLIPDRIDISERPTIVARKARLGDWEGDTVVSAGHKGGLLTSGSSWRALSTTLDGVSALDGFRTEPPDLAILDIKMPRMDGMETLRRLREKSELPVIFLTSRDDEMDELISLKMGADDYIRKPFSPRLLLERVKVLLRRALPKDRAAAREAGSKVLERGELRMDPERHCCTWKNEPVMLTLTEFLILQALASRPGVVKSRNALMDAAYDDEVYVDERTMDSHIKRLRRKFKARDVEFDMVETLYGIGYRVKDRPDG